MILSINTGSTSLKYALFTDYPEEVLREEMKDTHPKQALFQKIAQEISKHYDAKMEFLEVVHRVVHGGEMYKDPVLITDEVMGAIESLIPLAPLHNPYNLAGIRYAKKIFTNANHYAVFDTGFYKTLPDKTKIYPIPLEFYETNRIQRYGFHGISHQYALQEIKKHLRKISPNAITAHLGAGSSICAIEKGKAIDTSMGFTPMEGLMMWSRSGDMDLGILFTEKFTFRKKNLNKFLNKKCGLKGISGCNNYLELLEKYKEGDKKAELAFDMFTYRIQKYIGAYYAVLHGEVDAIAFTGEIGAGEPVTREKVMEPLPFLKNIPVFTIKPNEELMMARLIR